MKEFEGKVAVITGGAAGLGKAMAERFAAEGVKLVLADIEQTVLDKTVEEFKAKGVDVIGVQGDVAKPEMLEGLLKTTLDTYGKVNILCSNAGVAGGGVTWETTLADWEWVIGVNLLAVINGIRIFVPQMIKQGDECHIVNTASVAGLTSNPFMATYNVTKHGVVTLSETVHHELKIQGTNIGISVLCPGWVNTNIAESDRNRPAALANENEEITPIGEMLQAQVKQFLIEGLDPSAIGEAVFDAVKNDRFYILTHPEMLPAIQERMEGILEGKDPSYSMVDA